ncbi:MAG TPA: glycine zipper domain-containing protein [Rhizomicrobium sp.]|nr:glycine zipper domain-containing protein [Rhizomicrobium sp.]
MLKKIAMSTVAAALMLGLGTVSAMADDCSGKDHTTGTVLGAAGGGIIGGVASHGNGLGIIGGALLGGLAGNAISRDMDCNDQQHAARSYDESFRGRVGERHEWTSEDHDHGYTVTDREYRHGNRICRDFTQVTYRGGREMDRHGTACRDRRGGDWEFM